jgi:hypothetical protein
MGTDVKANMAKVAKLAKVAGIGYPIPALMISTKSPN